MFEVRTTNFGSQHVLQPDGSAFGIFANRIGQISFETSPWFEESEMN